MPSLLPYNVLNQCSANLPPSAGGYLVCQYCGTSLIWNPLDPKTPMVQGAPIHGMHLKPFSHIDTEGTGLELFHMFIPYDWQFAGGCRWLLDNPGMPACVAFQVSNPRGAEMFSVLPNINLTWNNNPMRGMTHPIGSRYFGAEVRPPMGIHQAIRELVLPRNRPQVERLQILSEEPQPDLPRLAKSEAAISGGSAEGGKVRIRYTTQGREFDEDVYGIVEIFRVPIASMFMLVEIQIWFVDYLFTFRAAVGLLDATMELYKVMIGSFQLNPEWYAASKSIAQTLAQQQIQRLQHVGQIGQIPAQTGSQMRQQNLNDWYARQQAYDRISDNRSRTQRGMDAFLDPQRQQVVELPSGYGQAWVNNQGEYLLTGGPDYNPNLSSNLNWVPMQPQ